ncbi:hypothetical protein Peur_054486 [Populus x canadensis]
MKNYIFHVYYYYKTQIVQRDQFKTNQSTVNIIQEVLAERLGVLSLLTRSRVQPLSLSAAGLLESPCHPGRGLVWAKPRIPCYPYRIIVPTTTHTLLLWYYSGYYSSAPPMPPRPFFDRTMRSYGSGPSAPVDLGTQRHKGGKRMGFGTGLAVGAVAGALGRLALEEGLKYEEEKIAEKVENDLAVRDDYSDYCSDY